MASYRACYTKDKEIYIVKIHGKDSYSYVTTTEETLSKLSESDLESLKFKEDNAILRKLQYSMFAYQFWDSLKDNFSYLYTFFKWSLDTANRFVDYIGWSSIEQELDDYLSQMDNLIPGHNAPINNSDLCRTMEYLSIFGYLEDERVKRCFEKITRIQAMHKHFNGMLR